MAKKKAGRKKAERQTEIGTTQTLIPGMEDDIPAPVKDAVDKYIKQMRAHHKAKEGRDKSKSSALDMMREHDVHKIRFTDPNGRPKVLKLDERWELIIETPKAAPDANGSSD